MARILWGFYGIGKSHTADGKNIIDADCNLFRFLDAKENDLHQNRGGFKINPAYPENYLSYIKSLPENVTVLVNCHVSYLLNLSGVVLIYPDITLKEEYIKRYIARGDSVHFIKHMKEEFEHIVMVLDHSPFRKYKIMTKGTYLGDLLEDGRLNEMFMTKKEMMELLLKAKDLEASVLYQKTHCNLLDRYCLKEIEDIEEFCLKLFEGEALFDFEALKSDIARTESGIAKEVTAMDRRGGLTHEELSDKIMQGIVNGALSIRYGEIAPYSHGYAVTYLKGALPGSMRDFTNRWECYCDFFDIGNTIAARIENNLQSDEVFGNKCKELNIKDLLAYIDEMEETKLAFFVPEAETNLKRATNSNTYPYRNDVATVRDVHLGRGLDGIVKHHYHGTYETMTPTMQNRLVEMLVCLKGFCLDALEHLDASIGDKENIKIYLKKQGIDICSKDKLDAWIRENPAKCAYEENRQLKKESLFEQLQSAKDLKEKSVHVKSKEAPVMER